MKVSLKEAVMNDFIALRSCTTEEEEEDDGDSFSPPSSCCAPRSTCTSFSFPPLLLKESTTGSSSSSSEQDDNSIRSDHDDDTDSTNTELFVDAQQELDDDDDDDDNTTSIVLTEDDDECWNSNRVDEIAQLWELSTQERSDLEELGRRLRDIPHDCRKKKKNHPAAVVRFLRGARGDPKAAETMFRNMIQWRRQNNVDTILQDYQPPPDLLHYWPGYNVDGFDLDGDPIYVDRGGRFDVPGMLARYGHDELIQFNIWMREKIEESDFYKEYYPAQHEGRSVKQVTVVEDVGGIDSRLITNAAARNLVSELMRMDQENYPEQVKRIIVIGLPSGFMFAWNLVKPLFGEAVCERLIFAGTSNGTKTRAVLAQYMDLQVLPDCIVPGIGQGRAAVPYMTGDLSGGPVPAAVPVHNDNNNTTTTTTNV